ncbi:hypothetical protein MKW98_020087 [Papaver atlanticum]|uniref:Uncharacterized protein n=1 Tax=Papaver atlanticum TaxID=357466 RepID=A0AAD4S167_9MAGN|nr:hypothetical protein MKW98_020087 [Papaver atlanticum]
MEKCMISDDDIKDSDILGLNSKMEKYVLSDDNKNPDISNTTGRIRPVNGLVCFVNRQWNDVRIYNISTREVTPRIKLTWLWEEMDKNEHHILKLWIYKDNKEKTTQATNLDDAEANWTEDIITLPFSWGTKRSPSFSNVEGINQIIMEMFGDRKRRVNSVSLYSYDWKKETFCEVEVGGIPASVPIFVQLKCLQLSQKVFFLFRRQNQRRSLEWCIQTPDRTNFLIWLSGRRSYLVNVCVCVFQLK